MIDTIAQLKHDRFILLTVIVACVLCPGFVFQFVFQRDLFISIDFLKLTMLSLAPAAPVFLINLAPPYLYFSLQPRGPSPDTLIAVLPNDLPNRDAVVKEHRLDGRRRDRETMNFAFVVAALLTCVPLYLPVMLQHFTALSVRAAVLTLIITEIVTFVTACGLGVWHLVRPQRRSFIAGEK